MTREQLDTIKAKPHGPDVSALIAEVERLCTRERTLLANNNSELELRRNSDREAYAWRLCVQGMRSHERIETYLDRQWRWSRRTFGEAYRVDQLLDHIRKELVEIAADPTDRIEWVDVALLALDGYNRCAGGDTVSLMPDLLEKQRVNFQRTWIVSGDGRAVEHDRSEHAEA